MSLYSWMSNSSSLTFPVEFLIHYTLPGNDHTLPFLSTSGKGVGKIWNFFSLRTSFLLEIKSHLIPPGLSIIIFSLKVDSFVLLPYLCHLKLQGLSPNFLHALFHWLLPAAAYSIILAAIWSSWVFVCQALTGRQMTFGSRLTTESPFLFRACHSIMMQSFQPFFIILMNKHVIALFAVLKLYLVI